nr:MAG TPA: hypothetical protein [Caudoviricetes sp.]DAO37714.1 MAG TPA: hypothetical protein [Caudoviricetes sp.]
MHFKECLKRPKIHPKKSYCLLNFDDFGLRFSEKLVVKSKKNSD